MTTPTLSVIMQLCPPQGEQAHMITTMGVGVAGESAPVTQLGERLAWTALMLVLVAGVYLLLLRGWRRRAARQADLPPLPAAPASTGAAIAAAEGSYVTTTREGDWLDRIVVHGLGIRGPARMSVEEAGVRYERQGAAEVFVPAAALVGVRLERGMAGKFVEEGGLVVVTWQHGERGLDTGFRPRYAEDRDPLVAAVAMLLRTREAERQ